MRKFYLKQQVTKIKNWIKKHKRSLGYITGLIGLFAVGFHTKFFLTLLGAHIWLTIVAALMLYYAYKTDI